MALDVYSGGETLRSLPQSWFLGMLLPVCSIGVLPILREMKRAGVRAGAITAFAFPPTFQSSIASVRPYPFSARCHYRLCARFIAGRHHLGLLWD